MAKRLIDIYQDCVVKMRASGGTNDFPVLLGDVINRELVDNFRAVPNTLQYWARITEASDYRDQVRIILSEAEPLLPRQEHQPVIDSRLFEASYRVKVIEYSRMFTITKEMIINDDIDTIKKIPAIIGRSAARIPMRVLHELLSRGHTINSYDGVPFFSSEHRNVSTTALTADIAGANAVYNAYVNIRNQRDISNREILGLKPRYLITGPALSAIAKILCESQVVPNSAGVLVPNPVYKLLEPVEDPFIPSQTAWYVVCDPKDASAVEVSFLNGVQEPQLFVKSADTVTVVGGREVPYDFIYNEIKYKVEYVFGVALADHKAIFRGNV